MSADSFVDITMESVRSRSRSRSRDRSPPGGISVTDDDTDRRIRTSGRKRDAFLKAASDRVDDEGPDAKFTRGEKNTLQILGPHVTEKDIDRQLQCDDDYFVWVPGPPPREREEQRVVGTVAPGDKCFLCDRGERAGVATDYSSIGKIYQYYESHDQSKGNAAMALHVYEYFEREIRSKQNEIARSLGEQPIPPWSAASIRDHFLGKHGIAPVPMIKRLIRYYADIVDTLYANGVVRYNAHDPSECRVSGDGLAQFDRSVQTLLKLQSAKVSTMFLGSTDPLSQSVTAMSAKKRRMGRRPKRNKFG